MLENRPSRGGGPAGDEVTLACEDPKDEVNRSPGL